MMLLEFVTFRIEKVGMGGAGFTFTVATTTQPSGSEPVTVTKRGLVPLGIAYVPIVVFELRVNGEGDQFNVEGFAADPEGVAETVAKVLPQTACKAEIFNNGAGVIVLFTTR